MDIAKTLTVFLLFLWDFYNFPFFLTYSDLIFFVSFLSLRFLPSKISSIPDCYEVTRNSYNTGVQLQIIQYIFRIKILSKDTPSFQRRNWLKNERYNEFKIRCSMSKTKYGEFEGDGLWSVKWLRWKWMTKWMSWTLAYEMNRWTVLYEMNKMNVTKQICNNLYPFSATMLYIVASSRISVPSLFTILLLLVTGTQHLFQIL